MASNLMFERSETIYDISSSLVHIRMYTFSNFIKGLRWDTYVLGNSKFNKLVLNEKNRKL